MGFAKSVKIVQIMKCFSTAPRLSGLTDGEAETETVCCFGPKLVQRTNWRAHSRRSGRVSFSRGIPSGYLAVYVGPERMRFVIRTHYLSHRLFRALLKRSEEEFGFHYRGGLNMACEPMLFEHLLRMIGADDPVAKAIDLEDILELYPPGF